MNIRIRTIIIDDTQSAVDKLQQDLLFFPEIEVIECISSAKTAVQRLKEQQPELLFLDIEMPGMSGLDILNQVKNEVNNMKVVFYTAHNQYLIDAIRTSAFDYLQKPYLPEELTFIINRLKTNYHEKGPDFTYSLEQLIKKEDRFAIQAITGLMFVKCDKVLLYEYLKEQRCWLMKYMNGTQYKLRSGITAKELCNLHSSFIQINQQCIINLNYLLSIENKTLRCIMYPPHSDIGQTVSSKYYRKLRENLDII